MKNMKLVLANWKSNKTSTEARHWVEAVKETLSTAKVKVVLCLPAVHWAVMRYLLPDVSFGAQTLSPYPDGAYTGAISARMASEYVQYALLGHVERRKYFGETNQMVAQQVVQAVENEITPLIAVDAKNWSSQLALLEGDQVKKAYVMYEPAEAISSQAGGHPADLDEVVKAAELIRSQYPVKGVLYGGSVDATNVHHYLAEEHIDGVVPGAASLDAHSFIQLIEAAK